MVVEMKRGALLVRVNGIHEPFQEFMIRNEKFFQRKLITYMLKSEETLETIVNCIINDRAIANCHTTEQKNMTTYARRTSISPANRVSMSKSFSAKSITPGRDNLSTQKRQLDQINDPKFPGLSPNGPFNRASLNKTSVSGVDQSKEEIYGSLKSAFKSSLFGGNY